MKTDDVMLVLNATAEGALERLRQQPIDLVIADVRLPGMNGIELLRQVQDLNRRIPVIILSRVDATETVIDAMRHGAFDYIVEPYDSMDLAARIHRAMRMSEILLQATPDEPAAPRIPFKNLVGVSPAIRNVMAIIKPSGGLRRRSLLGKPAQAKNSSRKPSTSEALIVMARFKSSIARPFRKAR